MNIETVNHRSQNKLFFSVNLKKIVIITILLFSIQGISYSAPPSTDNPDTQKQIEQFKTDAAASKKTIADLTQQVAQSKTAVEKLDQQIETLKNTTTIPKDSKDYFLIGVIAIGVICLGMCAFLIYTASTSPKDPNSALGLPDGTVRAIIAISVILFYILVSITLSLLAGTSVMATDVTKTLGTLVVAISAFYFGSKTAEAGAKAAANQNSPSPIDVPPAIIQQAIIDNKAKWMTLYGCTDIKLGKKTSGDTTHNLDCIVFTVPNKGVTPPGASAIPSTITYNSQGKDYNIPTDVQ